jgi:hypothetical protein
MFYTPSTNSEASMPSNTATLLPVGRNRELEPMADVRSPAQREAVRQIVARPGFRFALNNPFTDCPEIRDYRGPFCFLYQTTDGRLHADRLGWDGRLLRSARV